jgi:hypothetical protein
MLSLAAEVNSVDGLRVSYTVGYSICTKFVLVMPSFPLVNVILLLFFNCAVFTVFTFGGNESIHSYIFVIGCWELWSYPESSAKPRVAENWRTCSYHAWWPRHWSVSIVCHLSVDSGSHSGVPTGHLLSCDVRELYGDSQLVAEPVSQPGAQGRAPRHWREAFRPA